MSLPITRRRARGDNASRSVPSKRMHVGGDAAGKGDQPHHREHGHALAGTGFTDDAEHLATIDGDVDALDRAEAAARRSRTRRRGCGFRAAPSAPQLRIERVAQPVAEEVEGQDGDTGSRAPGTSAPTTRADNTAARRPASCPIPASAAARRVRGSRARRHRGSRSRSRARPARSSGAMQFGSTVSNISRKRGGAGAARGGDVVLREFGQRGGAHEARVAGQRDDQRRRASR